MPLFDLSPCALCLITFTEPLRIKYAIRSRINMGGLNLEVK